LAYINDHPGCYLRQIKKDLELSMGTTQYHLNYLIKSKRITFVRRGLRKNYFINGVFFSPNGFNLLQVLSQETAREILLFIIEKTNATQPDLIKSFGISGASVSWHIKRLLDLNLISESRSGKYKRYTIATDPEILINIVKNFRPGLWDKWSNRLADVSLSFDE
jgi:predicted transcriptional regulator